MTTGGDPESLFGFWQRGAAVVSSQKSLKHPGCQGRAGGPSSRSPEHHIHGPCSIAPPGYTRSGESGDLAVSGSDPFLNGLAHPARAAIVTASVS